MLKNITKIFAEAVLETISESSSKKNESHSGNQAANFTNSNRVNDEGQIISDVANNGHGGHWVRFRD